MIGVAIGPIRRGDDARTMFPDEAGNRDEMIGMLADLAIGQAEVFAPRGAKNLLRRLRLREPLLHRSEERRVGKECRL